MLQRYCTFYVVRHGETEWNTEKRYQGQQDSPLTVNGIRQAKDVAEKMKGVKFDAIFSSDLLRAQRTAEIIALEHKMAVMTREILRERNFGSLEGKNVQETLSELREVFEKLDRMSAQDRFKAVYADGMESDDALAVRLTTFIREAAVAYAGKNVLVVSHGGIMRAFLIHAGWATYEDLPRTAIENTGYFVMESDGVDFFINETAGIYKNEA